MLNSENLDAICVVWRTTLYLLTRMKCWTIQSIRYLRFVRLDLVMDRYSLNMFLSFFLFFIRSPNRIEFLEKNCLKRARETEREKTRAVKKNNNNSLGDCSVFYLSNRTYTLWVDMVFCTEAHCKNYFGAPSATHNSMSDMDDGLHLC